MAISPTRKKITLGAVGAVAASLVAAFMATGAEAAPRAAVASVEAVTTAESTTDMPALVEDFNYPDAARILQETKLKLLRGDGHIVVATCDASANQITIWSRTSDAEDQYCFRATAATGFLTLEVPEVFALQTTDHPISADLTAAGQAQTVDVPKDKMVGVGEGLGDAPTTLVELRITG
ncbi:hypothetical protein ACI2LJ_16805 [Streptomyces sp. NPDC088090]|uniref:hypothetical protein n=1 Tax=Streptomyces sp. NPDC088090 TaxID=3365822 RepID=UPI00384EF65F